MTTRDAPESGPDREIRVLYVEDNDETGPLVREWLQRHDRRLSVSVSFSLDDAFDRLAAESFDAIVADYRFPNGTGLELLDAARDGTPDVPFLLYSGRVDEEVKRAAKEAGATAVVEKGGADKLNRLAEVIISDVESRPSADAADADPPPEGSLESFAGDVVHDLRTPLSVAKGHLDMLESESDHTEGLREALDVLEETVDEIPERARSYEDDE